MATMLAELPCAWVAPDILGGVTAEVVGGTTALASEDGDTSYVGMGPFPPRDNNCRVMFPPTDVFDVDDPFIWWRMRLVAKLLEPLSGTDGAFMIMDCFPVRSVFSIPDPDTWVNTDVYETYFGGREGYLSSQPDSQPAMRAAILAGAGTPEANAFGPGAFGNNTNNVGVRVTYLGLQIWTDGEVIPPTPPTVRATRQYPREDGRGWSSAARLFPQPKSRRIVGGIQ